MLCRNPETSIAWPQRLQLGIWMPFWPLFAVGFGQSPFWSCLRQQGPCSVHCLEGIHLVNIPSWSGLRCSDRLDCLVRHQSRRVDQTKTSASFLLSGRSSHYLMPLLCNLSSKDGYCYTVYEWLAAWYLIGPWPSGMKRWPSDASTQIPSATPWNRLRTLIDSSWNQEFMKVNLICFGILICPRAKLLVLRLSTIMNYHYEAKVLHQY